MNTGNSFVNNTNSHCTALFHSAFSAVEQHLDNRKDFSSDGVNIEELLCKSNEGFGRFFKEIKEAYRKWSSSREIAFDTQIMIKLDKVSTMLGDEESKSTFDWYIQFLVSVILTNSLVETEKIYPYRINAPNLGELANQKIGIQDGLMNVDGYLFEMCPGEVFFGTWICGNYFLEKRCEPWPNDIVIDAGAFIGDTSIWFADRVGRQGKVYSFEIMPPHIDLIYKNVARNNLREIIRVIEKGLWDKDTLVFATQEGYDSKCSEKEGDIKINAITLDSFVQQENIRRVDFIKMDIEGAELNALRGGTDTIKKFKPRLAISIYHSPYDIMEIPVFIKSLIPEYKLYLSHKCPYPTDIILFASI
jgi:FkbM family methyltransferase